MWEFLDDLASRRPAPGGGSAAAIMAAIAAALVVKVCRLTIKKKGYESVWSEMEAILTESKKLEEELLVLAESDKQAFLRVVKERYSKESLKEGAETASQIAERAEQVSELAIVVATRGNKNVSSDAEIAKDLADLAEKSARRMI